MDVVIEKPMHFKLTFDNGKIYHCYSDNSDTDIAVSYNISETEADTSGNPLGVISSSTLSLEIFERNGDLSKTNKNSPYYPYMRSGVKIEVFEKYTDTLGRPREEPFGVYYSDSWQNSNRGGEASAVSISAIDRLTYICKLPIPELEDYAGVDVVDLYYRLLLNCGAGLTQTEIYADPSLELSMSFTLTKGARMMESLNSIAQALVARITLTREGNIKLMPAFPEKVITHTVDASVLEGISLNQNRDTGYNRVTLNYNLVSGRASEELARYDNLILKPGENIINDLSLSSSAVGLDGVYLDYSLTPARYENVIEYITYKGFQGGVSVKIFSNLTEDLPCSISVWGTGTALSSASISKDVPTIDGVIPQKVADTLMLESYIIQTEADASAYLDKVITYLKSIGQGLTIYGDLDTSFEVGQYITITDDLNVSEDDITGDYYVTGVDIAYDGDTSVTLTLYKVEV